VQHFGLFRFYLAWLWASSFHLRFHPFSCRAQLVCRWLHDGEDKVWATHEIPKLTELPTRLSTSKPLLPIMILFCSVAACVDSFDFIWCFLSPRNRSAVNLPFYFLTVVSRISKNLSWTEMKVCLNLQFTVRRRIFETGTNKPKSVAQFSIRCLSPHAFAAIIHRTLIFGRKLKRSERKWHW